jgi:Tol biopolymer transport system component
MKGPASVPGLIAFAFGMLLSAASSFGALQDVSVIGPFLAAPPGGDGDSWSPIVSPDGRYILYASAANNLALAGTNTLPGLIPPYANVYLRDRLSGTTTLVSVNLAGTGGGDGNSYPTGLSTNGQFALFESSADNLVANDNNNTNDVFVRDVVNGITSLVSMTPAGTSGNGGSRGSTLTPDGRYVAFVSAATNLVPNDTNGIPDVFVRDMQAGSTTLASTGAVNAQGIGTILMSSSEGPEMTPDGRYVAFLSSATNLVPGLTNIGEIYVRDMVNGTTAWASTNAQTLSRQNGAGFCYNQAISDDGQYVAFEISSNLPTTTVGCILRNNLQTGFTDVVSTNAAVPFGAFQDRRSLNLTPDGQTIVYTATNGNACFVNLWNAQAGTNIIVSVNPTNGITSGAAANSPDADPSGRYVVFFDTDSNLTGTLGGDIFVRDTQAGTTTLASVDTNGVNLAVDPGAVPALSANGQFVAFESPHANLDGRNFYSDVFIRNLTNNASELISVHAPSLPAASPNGSSQVWPGSISTNSQYIAFSSWGNNLASNDNNTNLNVFVRNLVWGTNILASVATNGAAANGMSTEPAISGNGRYVAFASIATNLAAGDPGLFWQIYVRDLQGGSNILVSVSTNGGFANGDTTLPAISTDGRYVLFWSAAQNLTFSTSSNLFVRDLGLSQTYALDALLYGPYAMTPDGQYVAYVGPPGNAAALNVWSAQTASVIYTNAAAVITNIAISPDGAWVAYASSNSLYAANVIAQTNCLIASGPFNNHASFQFSADDRFLVYSTLGATLPNDTNNASDVYLYDFQAGTNLLVSQTLSQTTGNGASDSPVISPDGRFIAYRSTVTNLVSDDTNTFPELFLYDRVTQTNILVSVGLDGGAGNNRSLTPYFSADSQTLIFESWASDLVPQDFNSGGDVFALDLYAVEAAEGTTNLSSALQPEIIFQGPAGMAPGESLVVTWPFASGTSTYSVQYKNNLTDPAWLNLSGTVTEIGNRVYITDFSPPPGQRFYRLVQNN